MTPPTPYLPKGPTVNNPLYQPRQGDPALRNFAPWWDTFDEMTAYRELFGQ